MHDSVSQLINGPSDDVSLESRTKIAKCGGEKLGVTPRHSVEVACYWFPSCFTGLAREIKVGDRNKS